MRKVRLNPQVLSTMFIGFNRHLFTAPTEGDMYSVEESNGDCIIYFDNSFYKRYVKELESAYINGKFAASNASNDWNDLFSQIKSAEPSELPTTNITDYYLSLKKFL